MRPTNEERRDRAYSTIDSYCLEAYPDTVHGIEIDDEIITDLLTDLQHFCQHNGHDFDTCLNMARHNFEAEK